jgi:beta-phosphoglucomutase-like phosphatase (HAD superfamily)
MRFDLIIFDCDGVLIDSEILSNRAEVELLKSFGIEFELSDYMTQFVGKSTKDVLKSIEVLHNVRLPENFRRLAEKQIFTAFQTKLKPITGIFEFITSIDTAKCVASSSSLDSRTERLRQRLDLTLKVTGLLDRFSPHIFSAEQVSRGKPAPDLFLFAAEKMQVPPDRCIVIEDSPHGVRAGIDAGMTVLGFTGGSHIQPGHQAKLLDEGAMKVFSEMSQLSAWLGQE